MIFSFLSKQTVFDKISGNFLSCIQLTRILFLFFRPKNGGRPCEGNRFDSQPCYSIDCVAGTDPRKMACQKYGARAKTSRLEPWPSPRDDRCSLMCFDPKKRKPELISKSQMTVPDGKLERLSYLN